MATKRPLGRYAFATMESLKMAEAMQALCVASLQEDFSAEDEKELSLERMSYEDYITELQSAVKSGTLDEFNDKLRRLITPLVTQVMEASQNPQQGQQ